MSTYEKRADVVAAREHAFGVMREYKGRTFYTQTRHGRGQTDYVRVYVADRDKITDITYYVARACESRLALEKGLPFGGGGYSKGLDAALMAARASGDNDFDQSRWQELPAV